VYRKNTTKGVVYHRYSITKACQNMLVAL